MSERVTGDKLREQLLIIDERIAFGQEAETALHAVKNQLLLSSMYLAEISPQRLGPEERDALQIVFDALEQSSELLRRTSAAGRAVNSPVFGDADLADLARGVVVLAEARAAQMGARIDLTLRRREVPIYADAFQIREILTNLVTNSLDALAGPGRVELIVGIGADGFPFAEVSDDGPGLSDQVAERLFTVRESTKPESGAGIGLTLSHAIASQHGGRLLHVSRKRRGATFRLVLPPRDLARSLLGGPPQTASAAPHTG